MKRKAWWTVYFDQAGAGDGMGASGGGAAGASDQAGAGQSAAQHTAAAADGGAADAGSAGGQGAGDASLFAKHAGNGAAAADARSTAGAGAGDGKALTPEQQALQAAEKDTRRPQHVPSKYWSTEKGEVNYEAWAKSTGELETRMRTYGLPPKDAGEYKFEIPEPLKAAGVDLDQTTSGAFRTKAHELGLTQKQYEGVMGEYLGHLETLAVGATRYGSERLGKELLTFYKTPEVLDENVKLAFNVVNAYGDDDEKAAALGPMGNTPPWVYRVLAKVGKELQEDTAVTPAEQLGGDSLAHLMRGHEGKEDSPYWNKEDPRHEETKRKVTAFHEAQSRAGQRRRGE